MRAWATLIAVAALQTATWTAGLRGVEPSIGALLGPLGRASGRRAPLGHRHRMHGSARCLSRSCRVSALPAAGEATGEAAPARAPAPSRAAVTCACGKARVTFATCSPRTHLECCCRDCRQSLEWAAAMGGPSAPQVPQVYYFENDLEDIQGEKHLRLYRLRAGARVTRLVATCCYSTLLADHPAYQGNVVSVLADACRLSTRPLPAQARIWTKDRDADPSGPPPAYRGQGPCLRGDEAWWPLVVAPALVMPIASPRRGSSLQELISRLPPPVVLGLDEGRRFSARGPLADV